MSQEFANERELEKEFEQIFENEEAHYLIAKRAHEFDQNLGKESFACARMIGKKFGRYVATIVSSDYLDAYKVKLDEYEKIFGFLPQCRVFTCGEGYKILWEKK